MHYIMITIYGQFEGQCSVVRKTCLVVVFFGKRENMFSYKV